MIFSHAIRPLALTLSLCSAPALALAQHVAATNPLSPAEQLRKFHLPAGFEIQLVASEPDIHKPINIAFDNRGRLWVTDTLEYPYPAKGEPRDSVKVLADFHRAGRARKITTFADKLNIPLGVLPLQNAAIVYSIPDVQRLTDTDADGRADRREKLYGPFGFSDTHGMVNSFTRALDGWIYACHGFANDSQVQGSDGSRIKLNSGNTVRFALDGSHIEYFTHGQVNPFGLTLDPLGNLFSADCHSMPAYVLLRGGYYPSFAKGHDGLGFAPAMMQHSHGSTGIGGICYYAADHFPDKYRDTLFIGNPVTGRVNHDRLERHGSTYRAIERPDFVSCDDPWFRPVNLQLGPDGALYVADFYNRIIGHYEVPLEHPGRDRERGRIWRIVYRGEGTQDRPAEPRVPDLSETSLEDLLVLLGDPNLTVRMLATHEFVDRSSARKFVAVMMLPKISELSAVQRAHVVWIFARLNSLNDELASRFAKDEDAGVRVHLLNALAVRDNWNQRIATLVRDGLTDRDALARRAAAAALARHPAIENVELLLELWSHTPADDTHLIHVVRMALRDQLLVNGIYAKLPATIETNADARNKLLDVSLGAATSESADFVWRHIRTSPETLSRTQLLHHVVRYISPERISRICNSWQAAYSDSVMDQADALGTIIAALEERGAAVPSAVSQDGVRIGRRLLSAKSEQEVARGINLAAELRRAELLNALELVCAPDTPYPSLRMAALKASLAIDARRSFGLLCRIVAHESTPDDVRDLAATNLAGCAGPDRFTEVLKVLQAAPDAVALAIARGLSQTARGGEALLEAVAAGKASPRLLQHPGVAASLTSHEIQQVKKRISELTAGLPPDQGLKQLIRQKRRDLMAVHADLARGKAAFQKSCAACHRIKEEGAKIGPNLDGIGARGLDRLLEDVIDPNRNVDQAFRTTLVATSSGEVISGLVLRQDGKLLVVADQQGKEIRVPVDEIENRKTASLSVMPSNLAEQVPAAEFPHLMAYLLSQREAAAKKEKITTEVTEDTERKGK